MVFAEKLDFLMKLTSTTNKRLGDLLSIHQSQISRMRSGARGIPGNSEYIRTMAEHFAARCIQDYQRSALAEALGRPPLRLPVEKNVLSVILTEWLIGTVEDGGEKAELFLRNYKALSVNGDGSGGEICGSEKGRSGDIFVYYGEAGKRAAVYAFLGYMLEQKEPQQIDLSCDENLDWMESDPDFIEKVQQHITSLAERGFTCRRITGPLNDLDYTYSSLKFRWLPLFISGRASSYFYPRLRDAVYHRMLLVAPGKGAVLSSSTGRTVQNRMTFFIKDPEVADVLDAEFCDYLAMCAPHMLCFDVRQNPERYVNRFTEFEELSFPCVQRSNSLSVVTFPASVAATVKADSPLEQKIFMDAFIKRTEAFKAAVREHPYTDAIHLATPEEIMAGEVRMPYAVPLGAVSNVYTVETYLLHLRSILWHIEHMPNYHVVLTEKKDEQLSFACVKESHKALLVRAGDEGTVIEVTEQNLVSAFSEVLHRSLINGRPDEAQRKSNTMRIRELIRRLETIKISE